jgi:glucosamine-6-phosphate deaminase
MNIHVYSSKDEVYQNAAGLFVSLLQTKPRAVLGMATGNTPIGVYNELIRAYRSGRVSFRQATSFNLDEYAGLPEDHPQCYHVYMRQHLFDHIDLPLERAFLPRGGAADLEEECARYDRLLEQYGSIDLQLLGIGLNGHIGFNEPAPSLTGGTHIVKLHEETRRSNAHYFSHPDEVPTHAVTMGVAQILQARTILLVAYGAEKADIVHRALTGPITTELPASLLQLHPQVIVMLDAEAGRHFR